MVTPSFQSLLDACDTVDPDDVWISLRRVEWLGTHIELDVELRLADAPEQHWRVECHDAVSCSSTGDRSNNGIVVCDDHPLLWPYTMPKIELFFHGKRIDDVNGVVGCLYAAHHETVGEWFPFGTFFNNGPTRPIQRLLEGGFGSFAAGPQELMLAYRRVLEEAKLKVSGPPATRPKKWTEGVGWEDSSENLVLLLLNDFAIISRQLDAERLQ